MAVELGRDARILVTHDPLDRGQACAAHQQERGGGVAEVVEADLPDGANREELEVAPGTATNGRLLGGDVVTAALAPDGGKGIRKALSDVLGNLAVVQRCQVHKRRNVREHLPQHRHAYVGRVMGEAYGSGSVDVARRRLRALANWLSSNGERARRPACGRGSRRR